MRESERQDEDETRTESGTERTEAQDEVKEEIVILILRTKTTQGKVYITGGKNQCPELEHCKFIARKWTM